MSNNRNRISWVFYLFFFFSSLSGTLVTRGQASQKKEFDLHYKRLHSGNWVFDKNFYLLTVIEQDGVLKQVLQNEESLKAWGESKRALIHTHVTDTCTTAMSLLPGFQFNGNDTLLILQELGKLYDLHRAAFDRIITLHLRPSGCYQRYATLTNKEFWLHAWSDALSGINHIIDQYGLDQKRHYASIDAVSYDIHGEYYQGLLKTMLSFLDERIKAPEAFYTCSLSVAWELLKANNRTEAANFEPLEAGQNKLALQRIPSIVWDNYSYAAIMVPGEGPEIASVEFDPIGRMRCELAAVRYRAGKAPFIIVSGGNVHPFHTPYTEALEMKKFLLQEEHIPEAAILIEPQARHTTTNFRNANRLFIRYGFPLSKPCLCVTTKDQADYIMDPEFDQRNIEELGYLPYQAKQRVSNHEIRYLSQSDCLQIDPRDPLDP